MKSIILAIALTAACGGSKNNNPPADAASQPDSPTVEGDCVQNPDPNNHLEIINACTDAQKIKIERPAPPLLGPGGSLPPLP